MIIGPIPDIPASQGTPPAAANAPVRPSQHGTEFARILASMTTSAPRNDQHAPAPHARDTQQDTDLPDGEDDITHIVALEDSPESLVQKPANTHDLSNVDVDTPAIEAPHLPDAESSTPASGDEPAILPGNAPSPLHTPSAEEEVPTQAKAHTKLDMQALPLHNNISPDRLAIARIRSLGALEFHAMPNARGEAAFATSMINAVYDHPFGTFTPDAVLTQPADTALQLALSAGGTNTAPLHIPATLTGATIAAEHQAHSHTKTTSVQAQKSDNQAGIATTPSPDGYVAMPAGALSVIQQLATPIALDTTGIPRHEQPDLTVRDQPVHIADFANLAATDAPANHAARATTSLLRNDAAFSAGIAQAIQAATANGDPVFELDMLDGMGGKLRIAVSTADGSVQISMLAGRLDMLDMLKRSLNLLLDDLTALGFTNVDLKLAEHGGDGPAHRLQLLETSPPNPPRKNPERPPVASHSTGMDLRL
ncbi:MAG: flagellar hook-length control protein FliK [Rhodobacteraceae bacterium]|nr:flagellar hook-length control protein FliK [Paracoccaceae bacterium]